MTDDEAAILRHQILDQLAIITGKMGELREALSQHDQDRFAHNWDHDLLQQMGTRTREWEEWRNGINRWRWTMSGALGFLFIQVTAVAALLGVVGHIQFH